jgi:hypothetical protein
MINQLSLLFIKKYIYSCETIKTETNRTGKKKSKKDPEIKYENGAAGPLA